MKEQRTKKPSPTDYPKIINNEEALGMFLESVTEFNEKFCSAMWNGNDFTVRLEVRGVEGRILHVRAYEDTIKRPKEKSL